MRTTESSSWSSITRWCAALLFILFGFEGDGRAAPPAGAAALPGLKLAAYDAHVGAPSSVGNLTVFPIYARANPDFADAVSLEHALAHRQARVRELGDGDGGDDDDGQSATVGAIVIENLGSAPIVVLAGTVVKGGKQDRQVAQDFVVAGKETVDVEAFCVESGRWTKQREGKNTGGQFSASGMLAPRKVRSAAQHDGDQSKVWDEVAQTNKIAKKQAGSGTLMATLDAEDVKAARGKLSSAAARALRAAPAPEQVLGVAYAIDGKVRGARWFATRQLFTQHQDKLLQSAAMEAQLAAPAKGAKAITAAEVRDFIDDVGKSAVTSKKKRRKAANTNFYKKSRKAGASEARMVKKKKNPRGEIEEKESAPVTVDVLSF